MIVVLAFTLAGLYFGVLAVRTHPDEAADDKVAVVLVSTFVGFVVGWLIVLVAGFFELVRTLP